MKERKCFKEKIMKNNKLLIPALAALLLTPAILTSPKSYASEPIEADRSEDSIKKDIASKKSELSKLNEEKTKTENELNKINEDLDKLKKEKTETENSLNEKEIKIKSNETLIDEKASKEKLDKEISDLEGQISENNKSLDTAKEEDKNIQKQIDDIEAKDKKEENPKQNEIDAAAEKKKAEELEKQRKEEVQKAKDLNRIYNDAKQTLIEVKVQHGILEYKYNVKNEFLNQVLANPEIYKAEDVEKYKKEVEDLKNDYEATKIKIKDTEDAVQVAKDNQIAFRGHSDDKHTSGSLEIGKEGSKHKARSEFKNNTLTQKEVEDKITELNKDRQSTLESYFEVTKNYDKINDSINKKVAESEKIKLENDISNGIRYWLSDIEYKSNVKNDPDFYYVNNKSKVKQFIDEDFNEYKEKKGIRTKIENEIDDLMNERESIKIKSIPLEEKQFDLENKISYYKELLELIKNGGPKEEESKEDPRLKELREKLLANKTNISTLENIIKNLQKELDQVKTDKEKLESLTDEDKAKLSSELETLKGEREEIQARLNEINSNITSKNQEKEKLEKLLAELNDKISKLSKAIDDLNLYLYNQNSIYYYPSLINEKSSEEKVKEIRQRSINRLKVAYRYSVKVVENAEYYLKTAKMSESRRNKLENLINRQKALHIKVNEIIQKFELEI